MTENAVYAAAADGAVVRLAPDSGQVVWRVDVKARLSAGVGSDGFTVVVATTRGEIIALGADGKELWRNQVGGEMRSPPLVTSSSPGTTRSSAMTYCTVVAPLAAPRSMP